MSNDELKCTCHCGGTMFYRHLHAPHCEVSVHGKEAPKEKQAIELEMLRKRIQELEEWQRIVMGTGTDQEAVIRMAATEYTKTAVQCWRDRVTALEQALAKTKVSFEECERSLYLKQHELEDQLSTLTQALAQAKRLFEALSQMEMRHKVNDPDAHAVIAKGLALAVPAAGGGETKENDNGK